MNKAKINGFELEYQVQGSGEPLLLISTGPIADSFLPFRKAEALERYRIITYHQRGQAGSHRGAGVVSFVEHAADAAALLRVLGVPRAHVAGHSTGGDIALQLAADHPQLVHTLVLLEPTLPFVPGAAAFFEKAGPALAAFQSGDPEGAMVKFLSVASGLDWETCRTVLDEHVPGGVSQSIKDSGNFFGGYLAALQDWRFGRQQAATITQPLLSVLGTASESMFTDGHELLHGWFSKTEDCVVDGVGHLLHMQRPQEVLAGVAAWLGRHPMGVQ
jgi:pimeloyl-ACP methyl ester carboxylesterase